MASQVIPTVPCEFQREGLPEDWNVGQGVVSKGSQCTPKGEGLKEKGKHSSLPGQGERKEVLGTLVTRRR